MWFGSKIATLAIAAAKTTVLLSVVFFFALQDAAAQKRFSKTYPASQNVRLQLLNRSGSVTVEGWTRNEVQIIANLEKPVATLEPQNLSGTIVINLVRDNQGRGEVGSVNFLIRIPYTAMVDIETMMGNLSITSIRSGLVRAKITSEGDITLTNIGSNAVSAENITGDIFFDGEIQGGGNYRFSSNRGNINIRIPFESSFRLVATAPSSRNISLGSFSNSSMNYVGNGRRVVGRFGDGSATVSVTNQQGSIAFLRR
ncbi:MAG: DUF4097 family beta strand repeat protein [Blastocatellia bacterium]|nr:DUF4097 family beta strand repeat protein [Blastocatellia bacterium]